MKANFVIPSWSYWREPLRAQPLTTLYLATILKQDMHKVTITDMRDGKKELPKANAHFYTVASPDLKEVKEIVEENPGIHIAGGPHPSLFPEQSLEIFDAISIGRGEENIRQMADDIDYKRLNKKYEITDCFDNYPFPDRSFLPREKIVTSLFKTKDIPSTTVLFSNGCPMFCTFCANYNREKTRRRNLDSISNEIDYLKQEYNIKGLSLQDEICIPKNKDEAENFLELLKTKDILWRGQTRVGVPKEILQRAKESGCLELSFGLESVDEDVLKLSRKGINLQLAEKTLKDCYDVGIKTRLYLLNGLPGEKKDIAYKTINFLERTNPDVVLLSTLQPYPGSEIASNPEKFGMRILDDDFSHYNHLRGRFANTQEELENAIPFEYTNGLSRREIKENLITLQRYLLERGKNK